MPLIPFILADTDDFGKLIFAIIAVIVWGLSALGSALSNQKKDARRRKAEAARRPEWNDPRRGPNPASPPPPPPPMLWEQVTQRPPSVPSARARPAARSPAPPPAPPAVRPAKRQQQQAKPRQQQQPAQRRVPKAPPLPPLPARAAEAGPLLVRPAATSLASQQLTNVPSAGEIRPLLRESLRRQIVINEILMPPVALRPPREP